jgi:Phosphatidylglycerophosphate synthase
MDYKELGRQLLYTVFDPLVHLVKYLGIKPNHITLVGLVLNLWAALHLINYLKWQDFKFGDNLLGFGIILGFAGLMDTMDGRLARLYDMKSSFGAFFDSVVDRYSEFIMFMGIVIYYASFDHLIGIVLSFLSLIGSIMVSYNRSRAEALGIDCSVGFMQRPERIVFVGVWAIIWGIIYILDTSGGQSYLVFEQIDFYTLGFLFMAISTNITALRRLLHSESQLRKLASN